MRTTSILTTALFVLACSGTGEEPVFRPRRAETEVTPPATVRAETPPETPPSPPLAAEVPAEAPTDPLLDVARWTERAPDTFTVELASTEGPILIDVTRAWAPNGADRFYNMVRSGLLTDVAFFRVVEGFMAQAGLPGTPAVARVWNSANITDDPRTQSNTTGMVSFAATGRPNSRATQFFINLVDNTRLDGMGFAPFGRVRDMTPVTRLYDGYGDSPPNGVGPNQGRIVSEGNTYLRASYPELDYIERARIMP